MLKKDSPELFDLIDDFDTYLSEAVYTLHPLVTVAKGTPTITADVNISLLCFIRFSVSILQGRVYLETKYHLSLL